MASKTNTTAKPADEDAIKQLAIDQYEERIRVAELTDKKAADLYNTHIKRIIVDLVGENIEVSSAAHANEAVEALGELFLVDEGDRLYALYQCSVCHREHRFEIKDLSYLGEFLQDRARIERICTLPAKSDIEMLIEVIDRKLGR